MISFRVSIEVPEDRRILLDLPSEVPTGPAELTVTIAPKASAPTRRPRSSLADWAEQQAEHWGNQLDSENVDGFTGRRY